MTNYKIQVLLKPIVIGGKYKYQIGWPWQLCERCANKVRFSWYVLGFDIKEREDAENVYLVKSGALFTLYRRKDFENMTFLNTIT